MLANSQVAHELREIAWLERLAVAGESPEDRGPAGREPSEEVVERRAGDGRGGVMMGWIQNPAMMRLEDENRRLRGELVAVETLYRETSARLEHGPWPGAERALAEVERLKAENERLSRERDHECGRAERFVRERAAAIIERNEARLEAAELRKEAAQR